MTKVSANEACKLVNKNRSTLYRHAKEGKVSKTIGTDKKAYFDVAELERVYGPLKISSDADETMQKDSVQHSETEDLKAEIARLQELINQKDITINNKEEMIEKKNDRIDTLQENVKLLTDDREKKKSKGFFSWLINGE